ncbi:MAG: hypothetical protein ACK5XN_34540 [Bacteroidota bacterium]
MRNTFAKQGYLQVLTWVSQQPHFTNKDLLARFPVSKSLIYDMNKLAYIKKLEKSVYKWNLDRDPKVSDVNALRRKVNQHNRLSKKYPKQLTIQPIHKAPAPVQSIPVVHEVECDNSNSKMLLIMAVGLLIGFLIATAIWK